MSDITANVVVSMPSQLFTMAHSFKAVANGKIYIGKIDTDPVNPENQIQVYVENEDGSHVPVSQPIIINAAGYPVYNGQIAKFVTVQGHSMAVYDAYGVQQFYFPNVLKYDPDQFSAEWLAKMSAPDSYALFGTFSSIADLRAFTAYSSVKENGRVYVDSYHLGAGYGGGYFRWNSTSTDTDDGGYTINPTGNTGTGRWKREISSAYVARTVSPLEFGAKINDSTFDCAPAINAAILYLNPYLDSSYDSHQGGDIVLPAGQFYINDTIYGSPNVRVLGIGGTPGFRYSRSGCSVIVAMPTMDLMKIMYDTAPWLTDGTSRYTNTNEMVYGRTESQGYYGTYIENIVFVGNADQQCGVRIWRVPCSTLKGVAVYSCKVSFWVNGSWDVMLDNCFSYGAKYATILPYQITSLRIVGGYYTGNTAQLYSMGTEQWFHRAIDETNKPNIAYVTTFMYAYNSFDINLYGVTIEGYNREFALFYCGNVNMFGGYTEWIGVPASETGHRVFVHGVASEFYSTGTYFNHDIKDLAVQSGNVFDTTSGEYLPSERSRVIIENPRVVTKFQNLTKDLGYGSYNIVIKNQHPITDSLSTTLSAQRLFTVQFVGLLDQYTMRTPAVTANGTVSFSIQIGNIADGGEYSVRLLMRNTASTVQQDLRFTVLVGTTTTVTGYQGRSKAGTTLIPAPTATFTGSTLTLTFTGNSGYYSFFRMKCVPVEDQPIYTY
ncbi:phage head-binding domain-containing protein [Escherichia coli]|uniref:phage head-binding domain-containing protein n=1 Tax=Escherichia coli TaxID=562 RepID=UPI0003C5F595|nr:phage head-binding domain-containing protein [Escherichia coli]EST61744.1 putative tailspike protein [Escherichia coli ECC-Z]OEN75102.1 hypothetical protein BHF54_08350 [Escherichia coli]